jgi:NAD(P)H-dependent FMN reductase
MKNITLVLGTARKDNHSQKVAEIVLDYLREKDLKVKFIDIGNFLFSKTTDSEDSKVQPWVETIEKSSGVIFVVPEYNHSYPGELKILIDSLFEEYKNKKAGIVSTSMGNYGGIRMVKKMNDLLHTVNFDVAHKSVNVSKIRKEIDRELMKEQLDNLLEEIIS